MVWYAWKWWIFAWSLNSGKTIEGKYEWVPVWPTRLCVRRRARVSVGDCDAILEREPEAEGGCFWVSGPKIVLRELPPPTDTPAGQKGL